jgi:hypothetical protein
MAYTSLTFASAGITVSALAMSICMQAMSYFGRRGRLFRQSYEDMTAEVRFVLVEARSDRDSSLWR